MIRNPLWSLRRRWARRLEFPQLMRRDGAVFLLDPGNWIDHRLLARMPYEDAQLARARALIAEHDLRHVVDIGANFGLYSVLLGGLPEIADVHAFEPVRRNHNQLRANIFANRLDAKITAHRLALGARDGEAVIHIDPRSTGISRLDLAGDSRDRAIYVERETIAIRRGDEVLDWRGRAVFAKIDVEGQAVAVLAGLAGFLAGNRGVIQIEIAPGEEAAVDLLENAGWRFADAIGPDRYFVKS